MARKRTDPGQRLGQRALRRLNPRLRALVAEYVRAEAELKALVATHLIRGDFESARVRRLIFRQASTVLETLRAASIPQAQELVREAYEAGVRIAGEQGHNTIEEEAVRTLQDNLENSLDAATNTVGRRVEDVFRREGLRFAAANASGDHDLPELTKQFADRLREEGVTSFVDKAGRQWGLENYAEMAIRTTTTEARTEGTSHTLITRGFDLVTVHNPTGGCPRICADFVGKTYSLTGRADGYPVLDRPPPFHGRCECFIAPARDAAAERREARQAA